MELRKYLKNIQYTVMNMGAAGGDKSSRSPPPFGKSIFVMSRHFFPMGGLFHSLCGALFATFFSMWRDPHIKFSASAHSEDYNTQELNRGSIDNQGKSHLTLSDPGYFRQLTIRGGGGALKAPPLRSRKLLCQSSLYHTCAFYQVF